MTKKMMISIVSKWLQESEEKRRRHDRMKHVYEKDGNLRGVAMCNQVDAVEFAKKIEYQRFIDLLND